MKTLGSTRSLAAAVALAVGALPLVALHAQPSPESEALQEERAEIEREVREIERQVREEARERAREERERAREARDQAREQARAERERRQAFDEALREARRALDEGRLDVARERFRALSEMEELSSGAPLYWLAYVDAESGRISDALESLSDFFQRFPRDVFFDDAIALRVELARKAGDVPAPPKPPKSPQGPSEVLRNLGLGEAFDEVMNELADLNIGTEIEEALAEAIEIFEDSWEEAWTEEEAITVEEELQLLALDGLLETNPDRAVSYLRQFITGEGSGPARRQALTLLSRTDHPDTSAILLEVVRSADDEELQREALRLLGLSEGPAAGAQALLGVYEELQDEHLRRAAIEGLMLSEDVDGLLTVFRQEPSADLRAHVVRHLGMLGALDSLRTLYRDEDSPRVQAAILDGFALAGDAQMLIDIASFSDDEGVVKRAVRALAVVGNTRETAQALDDLFVRYRGSPSVQQVIADTLVSMDDGDTLVSLYRRADDTRERALLVERLRLVGGDAAEAVFLEILDAGS
ncbi:MAG: HEAT repeat domain-containing protein [Pseudomonadota bacterium]